MSHQRKALQLESYLRMWCSWKKFLNLLNIIHREDGSSEYVFLVEIPDEQEIHIGYDPEIPEGQAQEI